MRLPLMYKARQKMPRPKLDNVEQKVRAELVRGRFWAKLKPGARIAVTAGSRGISNIDLILRTVISVLQEKGAQPFLVAAMGSHGGGTAQGQLDILKSLGITETAMGAPVLATTEAREVGCLQEGLPAYQNKLALESDGIIVVNRVKPHTSFRGEVESGLMKMMVVGLGNAAGATAIHNLGTKGLRENLLPMGRLLVQRTPVLFGLGIVENGYEETAWIEGLEPEQFAQGEGRLLQEAKRLVSRIPFDQLDILVVEEMGKVFSGTGMDTNVIGRLRIQGQSEPETPQIKRIVVLDLAHESHGNANGIGLADFTTRRLVEKIDYQATYTNVLAATFVQRAMIPMFFPTARESLGAALKSLGLNSAASPGLSSPGLSSPGLSSRDSLRMVRIKNTLCLDELFISQGLLAEAGNNPHLEVIEDGHPFGFDGDRPTPDW